MSEISGCPRIGCSGEGKPSIRFPDGAWGSRRLHFVECQSCFVRGPAFDDNRERAITEWNALHRPDIVIDREWPNGADLTIVKCPIYRCHGTGKVWCIDWNDIQLFYIKCQVCHVQGPPRTTPLEATQRWNELCGCPSTKQEECPERSQEQVKPVVNACPICHDLPDVHVDAWPGSVCFAQAICECGVHGAIGLSKQEAIEYWNMLSSEGGWTSVKDELPKTSDFVLVCEPYEDTPLLGFFAYSDRKWYVQPTSGKWRGQRFEVGTDAITHWRPLPNLPKPVEPDSTSGWISVKDGLPVLCQPVLVYSAPTDVLKPIYYVAHRIGQEDNWCWFVVPGSMLVAATHWRPLPDSPDDEG